MKRLMAIFLGLVVAFAANADVIGTTTDGTYFEVTGTPTINPNLIRIGGSDSGTITFVGLTTFDISGYAGNLAASTFTLDFTLGIHDNSPALADLTIEYIGTVADAAFNVTNAELWADAATVTTIFSGAETVGVKSYDASAISSDSFANDYAVFRFTKSSQPNQWNIPNGSPTLTVIPLPGTIMVVY